MGELEEKMHSTEWLYQSLVQSMAGSSGGLRTGQAYGKGGAVDEMRPGEVLQRLVINMIC